MTDKTEASTAEREPDIDLMAAVRRVLEASNHPMTLSKIRLHLPKLSRNITLESLSDRLRRQATAGVFVPYPKYRSRQDRYWDRPMEVHIAHLLRETLAEKPLTLSELRRKLPDYAKAQAETVLLAEVERGALHRHPVLRGRGGPRFGVSAADPKDVLRTEFTTLLRRLEGLGFTHAQLRHAALELLHEEEWAAVSSPQSVSLATEPDEQTNWRRDPASSDVTAPPHDTTRFQQSET